jgi:hypothetical protein
VGAIHGRLLTAWSAAGIFGPVIVNYLREYQLEHGVPRAQVYDITAYVLCSLLAVGFICNWLIKPVADKHFMTEAELEAERKLAHEAARAATVSGRGPMSEDKTPARSYSVPGSSSACPSPGACGSRWKRPGSRSSNTFAGLPTAAGGWPI